MAATKYQVLYRYTNPNSNQLVLNNVETKYKKVFEFYHDKHKIEVGTDEEKLEANKEKSQLIIDGNNTANDNYNMLFKFTGTRRINKKVWVAESKAYVIRDKEAVRDKITRAVDGDYSGDYLLVEGDTIENGVVVARKNPVTSTIYINQNQAANGTYFADITELENVITNSTIAKLKPELNINHFGALDTFSGFARWSNMVISGVRNIQIKVGSNFTLGDITYYYYAYSYTSTSASNALTDAVYASIQSAGGRAFSEIKILPTDVEEYIIPAHYEDDPDYPYVVHDTYERIEQSPWIILSTHGSLTSALEKAKAAVSSIGLENVKIIKVVPIDQFVKIN